MSGPAPAKPAQPTPGNPPPSEEGHPAEPPPPPVQIPERTAPWTRRSLSASQIANPTAPAPVRGTKVPKMPAPPRDVVEWGAIVYVEGIQPGVPIQSTKLNCFGVSVRFVMRTSVSHRAPFCPCTRSEEGRGGKES